MPGGFVDPNLPADFAPFNVQEIAGRLVVVAYAEQDPRLRDEIARPGTRLRRRVRHAAATCCGGWSPRAPWTRRGAWRSPRGTSGRSAETCWWATSATGRSTPTTRGPAHSDGTLQNKDGNPIKINGLWALRFGNGVIGTPQSLLFTAGIGDEDHGLFGEIVVRGSGE